MTELEPLKDKIQKDDGDYSHNQYPRMRIPGEFFDDVKSAVEGLRQENCSCSELGLCYDCRKIMKWLPDLYVVEKGGEEAFSHCDGKSDSSSPSNITYQEHKKDCPSCQYTEQNKKVEDGGTK